MDEMSWRAKLLKSNINITGVDYENEWVFFDFAYRPHSGQPQRWGKTVTDVIFYPGVKEDIDWEATANKLKDEVLSLRKELEG